MTHELTKKLYDRFEFYRPHIPITESLMKFGFECNDGWFDLIWRLSEKLEQLEKEKMDSIPADEKAKAELEGFSLKLNVVQVKEKFGGLRFYADNASSDQYDEIDKAESESETICESCGKSGSTKGKTWLYTACDEHSREEDVKWRNSITIKSSE